MDKFKKIQDDETKKILQEMEEDGIKTDTLIPENETVKQPVAPTKDESTDDDDDEDDKKTSKKSSDDEDDEDEDDTDSTDEDTDENSDEADEDDEANGSIPKSKYDTVLGQMNYWKNKAKRAAKRGDSAEQVDEEVQTAIKEFAQKNDIDEAQVTGMFEIFKKSNNVPPALQKLLKKQEEADEDERQSELFVDEFNSTVAHNIKRDFPNATPDEVKSMRKQLKQLAFSSENSSKSLVEIYFEKGLAPKKSIVSGEDSSGVHINETVKGLDEIDAEDIENMSPEEFAKYSDSLGKQSTYKVKRRK